jgi:hypothetical protein
MDNAVNRRESEASGGTVWLRRCLLIALIVIVTLAVLAFVVPYFISWSPLNCWHEDIDITCGRMRTQHYILGLRITDTTEDTEGSELYVELVGEPGAPEWRRVNTFSPGCQSSPHYTYHSSFSMLRELIESLRWRNATREEMKDCLTGFFKSLQKGNNDAEAKTFMQIFRKVSLPHECEDDLKELQEEK